MPAAHLRPARGSLSQQRPNLIGEVRRSRPRIRKIQRDARRDRTPETPVQKSVRSAPLRSALIALVREPALLFRFATYPLLQTEMRRVLLCKLEPISARIAGRHDCCIWGEVRWSPWLRLAGRDRLTAIVRGRNRTSRRCTASMGGRAMDLTVWIPGLFSLGLILMGFVYAFLIACENI